MTDNLQLVGNYEFPCGICSEIVPIPVYTQILVREDGNFFVDTYPDTATVWLHLWAEHPEESTENERSG